MSMAVSAAEWPGWTHRERCKIGALICRRDFLARVAGQPWDDPRKADLTKAELAALDWVLEVLREIEQDDE